MGVLVSIPHSKIESWFHMFLACTHSDDRDDWKINQETQVLSLGTVDQDLEQKKSITWVEKAYTCQYNIHS